MDSKVFARGTNTILGAWLFISAFLWQHNHAQFMNAWVVGLLVAAVSTLGFWAPSIRFANTMLGAWLFASLWVLPMSSSGTFWNHLLVALAIFITSLIPSEALFSKSSPLIPRELSSPHSA